jgi:AraC family transcriptional regulator
VMNRSPSAFRKIFKDETGASPLEFLIRIRLERSRKLLVGTDMPVTDIAFACGFNSSSHFTTTFTKQYSLSPRDYKKYHANGVTSGAARNEASGRASRASASRAVEAG